MRCELDRPQHAAAEATSDSLGRAAVAQGCAALEAADSPLAVRWFSRAQRLAPEDSTVLFLRAAATGLADATRALALLDVLLREHPSHAEGQILQVSLLHRQQRHAEAARALSHLLGNLAAPETREFSRLADTVCAAAGEAGWIGVSTDGTLLGDIQGTVIELGGRRHGAESPGLLAACARSHVLRASRKGRTLLGSPLNLRSIRKAPRRAMRMPAPVAAKTNCAAWRTGGRGTAILLVTHDLGGGVERQVAVRVGEICAQGLRAIVLRPGPGSPPGTRLCDGASKAELVFRPDQFDDMAALLRLENCRAIEFHHWAAHAPEIRDLPRLLDIPYHAILHDYAPICPRVTLCDGAMRFCGEPPDVRDCDDCITDHGARIPFDGGVGVLRRRQAEFLAGAGKIIAPSRDTALRLRRHMPMLDPVVEPWENDAVLTKHVSDLGGSEGPVHVALVGALGQDKGFDVLLACARDAARRSLALRFTVVGHTIDDSLLMQAGPVFVSGRFEEGQAQGILVEDRADIGFLPSVWPETWCFALSALWQAGLSVIAFNIGAQAERIRATGAGSLLPLGLPAQRINDALMRAGFALRSGTREYRCIA